MKSKAFTLIELLAVVVIIGIIAIITTPIIMDVIYKARRDAFVDSAYSLVDAAQDYRGNAMMKHEERSLYVNYGTEENIKKLEVSGELPNAGELSMDKDGNIKFMLWSNKANACVSKDENDSKVTLLEDVKKEDCHL